MLIAVIDGLEAKALAERHGMDVSGGERLTGFLFTADKRFHLKRENGELVLRFCLPLDDGGFNEADPPVHLGAWTSAIENLTDGPRVLGRDA